MNPISPFGERSFEREKNALGEDWSEYFFEHAPFNNESLKPKTYLIVGRRGCGKSSLAEYFKFQPAIPNATCIHIGETEAYNEEFFRIAEEMTTYRVGITESLSDLWTFCIWQAIFRQLGNEDVRIKKSSWLNPGGDPVPNFLTLLLRSINQTQTPGGGNGIATFIQSRLSESSFVAAQEAVLERARKRPIILTIDSKEQYRLGNEEEMRIAAALVQGVCTFNVRHVRRGVHVKAFITDEIFPHLKESFITNTAKYVCDPLFLHWRPKDLIRLVCWRFFKYLRHEDLTGLREEEIDWDNFTDVHKKLWVPYFGEAIENRKGISERTLPYILRHTQLRPRQVIMICNKIAEMAIDKETFPHFPPDVIRDAVRAMELELAEELINSYREIYPQVGDIISALSGFPMEFKGNELDRVAHRTAKFWRNEYSPIRFRQIVAELGVVGRKREERDERTGIVEADFEFAMQDRLFLHEQDDCLVHPMFYRKLNIRSSANISVHPFPDHPDFAAMKQSW
ncbi:MAG TPA: hypothetical protein VN493_27065 [Thermoanaerobaculia bacterium]|nr:hypothetical protein [Thermoanaerobaculia bacterium]